MKLSDFNPFSYSLNELQPLIVSAIFLAGFAVTLFVTAPVGLIPAVAALVGPVFAVIGVFVAKAHSVGDLSKALEQLKGAALTVAVYFVAIPADTANKIGVLIAAFVSFVAVIWAHKAHQATLARSSHRKLP